MPHRSARPPEAIDLAEDRDALRGAAAASSACARRRRRRAVARGGARRRAGDRLPRCSCGPATCSAAARWRSCYDVDGPGATTWRRGGSPRRRWSRDPPRPVPRGRDRGRRRRRSATARTSDRRDDGAHRGGRHPLRRQRLRAAAALARRRDARRRSAGRRAALALALGVVGLHERAVRGARATTSTCSRSTRAPRARCPFVSKATGVPLAKLAAEVMLRQTLARLRLHGGVVPAPMSRSRMPVFPFDRFPGADAAARPGDALDRRGDGHRRRLRRRVRQGPGRRRPRLPAHRHACS